VLVERYTYDVFGRPTIRDANGVVIEESAFDNPYLFTARAYEAESGLYYYRARYYDYYTGRFLQPDPTGYDDGLNLYGYCANNPLGFLDPRGLCKSALREGLSLGLQMLLQGPPATSQDALMELIEAGISGHPTLEYLWEGRLLGTGYGESSLKRWAEWHNAADSWGGKFLYGLGGCLAAAWTADTWKETTITLASAAYGARGVGAGRASSSIGSRGSRSLSLRRDITLSGGRSGQNVKNLTGPPNSAVKGSAGRVYITNDKGQVILDVTSARAKQVTPGVGFGKAERPPTPQELDIINRLHGG